MALTRTTAANHEYYVTDRDTQKPLGVYEAPTPYLAINKASRAWSVPTDQLTAQELHEQPQQ